MKITRRNKAQFNGRRCELIQRKHFGGGLTTEETVELEILQKAMGEYMQRACPRDGTLLEEQSKRLQELKRKPEAKRAAGQ